MESKTSAAESPGENPGYHALLGLSIAFSLAALATLLPWPSASWPNVLGYRSLCPFAPAATAACAAGAALSCLVRSRLVSARKASNRYRPLVLPLGVFFLILAIGLPAALSWAGYKQQAAQAALDGTAASSADGQP